MSTQTPTACESSGTDDSIEPVDELEFSQKTGKRAVYEAWSFEQAGDIVRVWNQSHGDDVEEHVYTVELDHGGVPKRCTCPAYEYHCKPGEACKHMVAAALHDEQIADVAIATDGGQIIDAGDEGKIIDREPDVEYTYHTEPPAQGGKRYVRCEGCGAELLVELGGKDALFHREGCPATEGR